MTWITKLLPVLMILIRVSFADSDTASAKSLPVSLAVSPTTFTLLSLSDF